MKSIVFAAAVLLITGWLVGIFIYALGAFVHVLLLASLALILVLSRLEKQKSLN